ncbi:Mss4-like protein [Powellomyces hirtus]|nr:Mss4-like protein [Powellomyces hirtus]
MSTTAAAQGALQFNGSCYCGKVKYSAKGPLLFSAYCHCTICQRISGAPYVHAVGFPPENLKITAGTEYLSPVQSSDSVTRYHCTACHSHVYGDGSEESFRFRHVLSGTLERDGSGRIIGYENVAPQYHIFYENRTPVTDCKDGLPKWAGFQEMSERL